MSVAPDVDSPWGHWLDQQALSRREQGLWRQRRVMGKGYLDFAGNDYLGLALDPRVIATQAEGARRWGAGAGASHLVSGHLAVHEELEQRLAALVGRPRALLFSTGYMANLSVLQALCDSHTAVFQDRLNHASLLDGARLAGARSRRFHHRDLDDLHRLLARSREERKLVVSDGVFSMDGDSADIAGLAATAASHRAWLMIDDAHGLGVLGSDGDGCVGRAYDCDQVPILVGTLGKALGTAGAFVAGSQALIEHLIQYARGYVYTTAQPPAIAAATLEALTILEQEPERRTRLHANIAYFRQAAAQADLPLAASSTPIQPLMLHDTERAMCWAEQLNSHHIAVGSIREPTVPKGQARLRITLKATHQRHEIDRLVSALIECQARESGS
ncbi:8-amino-7-oxononanoate synthase [Halomonas sp. ZH2S]|uniref:8-amino-7-oxononanoate synthase n=1 Tax=Vreelandella zhuhanensis TaxID=2684210 RepID=A0A7X3KPD1_9GAMM|nr:8-amino-7-oxononanoate synthase [Halomonas zhuhanensis]MWJ27285.1 8-amino-7-oxononanoate synthase [Halomonas zhuhanensis]